MPTFQSDYKTPVKLGAKNSFTPAPKLANNFRQQLLLMGEWRAGQQQQAGQNYLESEHNKFELLNWFFKTSWLVHQNLYLVNELVRPLLFTKSRYLLNRGLLNQGLGVLLHLRDTLYQKKWFRNATKNFKSALGNVKKCLVGWRK